MIGKSNEYLAVSLSEEALKIAQIKGSGSSRTVVKVTAVDVKGLEDSQLPETVQSALKGFSTKKAVVFSVIPPSMTSTKNIEVPSVNPEEIKSIVSLQAGRHTPFSREEIQIGYVNIGVHKNNYTKVLLVIANRNILKNQIDMLESAGLKIKKVLFAPEGIANFYSQALGLEGQSAPTAIIDVDKYSTDLLVVANGKPIMTRNIRIGKEQLSQEGKSASEKLVAELKKTIDSYQSEDIDQMPAEYVFTSGEGAVEECQKLLSEKLNWNSRVSSYVDLVKSSQNVLHQLGTEYADTSFLDLIASSDIVDSAHVNLIPEEIQLQKSVEAQTKEVFRAFALAIVILFLVACAFGSKLYFQNTRLNKLKSNYRDNRQEVINLEDRQTKTSIIKRFLESRMISLDIINELYRNIPNEIYLSSIQMDEDGNISVQGISDIASLIFNLGSTLKESDLFESVEIQSTTAKKDRGKDVSAFEIALELYGSENSEDGEETEAATAGETP